MRFFKLFCLAGCSSKLNHEQQKFSLMFTPVSPVKIWNLVYWVGGWRRKSPNNSI